MSMDLARQDFSTKEKYFIAGTTIPITTAVKQAGEALDAHTPVLLADGKVKAVADPGSAEKPAVTEGLNGITADSAGNGEDTVIYLTGEFFADELVLPQNVTAAALEVPLRNIGIFLK